MTVTTLQWVLIALLGMSVFLNGALIQSNRAAVLEMLPGPIERIVAALSVINNYGGIDGNHHKEWVIDQVVRALTGCPTEQREGVCVATGERYTYDALVENDTYRTFVADHCAGEDGPETYGWSTGIAP